MSDDSNSSAALIGDAGVPEPPDCKPPEKNGAAMRDRKLDTTLSKGPAGAVCAAGGVDAIAVQSSTAGADEIV